MSHLIGEWKLTNRMLVTALFMLLCCAGVALAQTETGQIAGTVKDPNGAVVPGASVSVKAVNTGAMRTATANDQGQ